MIKSGLIERNTGSFRDPSGFLYIRNGVLYRQVNTVYKENYDQLMNSGLYEALVDADLLISHEETGLDYAASNDVYKVIKPEKIPFISYPYEWCFSQLKDAALTTLAIQKHALKYRMTLKDASAYNIQFKNGKPVFIDTLSFEPYIEGRPWVAYRQFCQHFLCPLALICYKDVRLSQLLRIFIDGIPVDLTSRLLPPRTSLVPSLLLQIHLQSKSQRYYLHKKPKIRKARMSSFALRALIDSLESGVRKLKWSPKYKVWADYYNDIHYTKEAFKAKKRLVADFLDRINPKVVWDLGGNVGLFSRIASDRGIFTVSFDNDMTVIEANYLECQKRGDKNLLPLLVDLTNPSPAIGWANQERASLIQRGQSDTIMALALIHHLAIANNAPFSQLAKFFKGLCKNLIIEFVPKKDPKVQQLLSTRDDIFEKYNKEAFEKEFSKNFKIISSSLIQDSDRVLYLMVQH